VQPQPTLDARVVVGKILPVESKVPNIRAVSREAWRPCARKLCARFPQGIFQRYLQVAASAEVGNPAVGGLLLRLLLPTGHDGWNVGVIDRGTALLPRQRSFDERRKLRPLLASRVACRALNSGIAELANSSRDSQIWTRSFRPPCCRKTTWSTPSPRTDRCAQTSYIDWANRSFTY
jgi:hypothetical protein